VQRTVQEHLDSLHAKLEMLNHQLMESAGQEQTNRCQTEIRGIELVIAHYEAALKLEKRILTGRG
jgi:hypothetical protein